MSRTRTWLFLGGALAGGMIGWLLAQRVLEQQRQNLFSARPWRRFAALGYLAGQHGVDTVRLLRDYLTWESQPMLRRRAQAIVARMEATLG
jgi:hypothetical protein